VRYKNGGRRDGGARKKKGRKKRAQKGKNRGKLVKRVEGKRRKNPLAQR